MKKNMLIVSVLALGLSVLTAQAKTPMRSMTKLLSARAVVESFLLKPVPSRASYRSDETFIEAIAPNKPLDDYYDYINSLGDLWKRVVTTPLHEPTFCIDSSEEKKELSQDLENRIMKIFGQPKKSDILR